MRIDQPTKPIICDHITESNPQNRYRKVSKVTHKQIVPKIAKKWSLNGPDFILLKFGFFWELIEK